MGMVFDKKTLIIPDNTVFEEKNILSKGDVIIGDRSEIGYGFLGKKRVFIGEKVSIRGNVNAKDDVRIDMWSMVDGDISGGKDIYLGEKVKVSGKVSVGRDLDVGDNVDIKDGFEARGWIRIRNPIPIVIYVFLYILELLRQGKSSEVEKILSQMEDGNESIPVSSVFLFVPNNSVIDNQRVEVKGNCRIGDNCRVLGNHLISGNVKIGKNTEIYGAISSDGNISIGGKTVIQGDVKCNGSLFLEDGCQILGDVKSKWVKLSQGSIINGTIKAENGIKFKTEKSKLIEEKLERFNKGIDEIGKMLD